MPMRQKDAEMPTKDAIYFFDVRVGIFLSASHSFCQCLILFVGIGIFLIGISFSSVGISQADADAPIAEAYVRRRRHCKALSF